MKVKKQIMVSYITESIITFNKFNVKHNLLNILSMINFKGDTRKLQIKRNLSLSGVA